jgi:hypothetical protein
MDVSGKLAELLAARVVGYVPHERSSRVDLLLKKGVDGEKTKIRSRKEDSQNSEQTSTIWQCIESTDDLTRVYHLPTTKTQTRVVLRSSIPVGK